MYKVTRLYTDGVRQKQEPVDAFVVHFRDASDGTTSSATINSQEVVPTLRRACVTEIDTWKKRFTITGIEELECGDQVMEVAQAWLVEEVEG